MSVVLVGWVAVGDEDQGGFLIERAVEGVGVVGRRGSVSGLFFLAFFLLFFFPLPGGSAWGFWRGTAPGVSAAALRETEGRTPV